jgi:hypothetical protein
MPDHSLLPVLLVLMEAGDSVCALLGGGKAAFILTAVDTVGVDGRDCPKSRVQESRPLYYCLQYAVFPKFAGEEV